MQFNRLRLTGFKSFVEPTDLLIEPGLTGVVGPNGCGKSNLLEAIRWVMGESSYKNMRGTAMEDVIFSGNSKRPARNMAEVALYLDNKDRTAPAAFNDSDTLEVVRKIERDTGSAYKINGKDARARDVQLLFADASSGARSPALVRQGQISEIIAAKPKGRRKILEEAAGITGLYTRRHEAELRLRGAETNLTRLDDVMGQLEIQLVGLKRQARQASRYRNISSDIRKAEAIQLYLKLSEAEKAVNHERSVLDEIMREIGTLTKETAHATRLNEEAVAKITPLRQAETVAAAVLHRCNVEQETLDAEEARADQRRAELKATLEQVSADVAREQEIVADADGFLERLEDERSTLQRAENSEAESLQTATSEVEQSQAALNAIEEEFEQLATTIASLKAARSNLEKSLSELDQRHMALVSSQQKIIGERDRLGQDKAAIVGAAEAKSRVSELEIKAQEAEAGMAKAEAENSTAQEAIGPLQVRFNETTRSADKLQTEVTTLRKILSVAEGDLWPPLVDAVQVKPGYERALGAALGDDLDMPADTAAPVYWDQLSPLDTADVLPGEAQPLSDFVTAPAALGRRLSHIGVVGQEQGKTLQKTLKAGVRLVSKQGDLWRWDGFTAAADAPTAAAMRLAERNRLDELEGEAATSANEAEVARKALDSARETAGKTAALEQENRALWRSLQQQLGQAKEHASIFERQQGENTARALALVENLERLEGEISNLDQQRVAVREELSQTPEAKEQEKEVELRRADVHEKRSRASECRALRDGLAREADGRRRRLDAMNAESKAWIERKAKAEDQVKVLASRADEARKALEDTSALPQSIRERREKLIQAISKAEAERNQAADRLAIGEKACLDAANLLRNAETALSEVRENRARNEERLQNARQRQQDAIARIEEVLKCTPETLLSETGVSDLAKMPDLETIERKLERIRAERERLGGVNLRADEEAVELQEQLDTMNSERNDLEKAIARLRQGISSLNSEGRERLLVAFKTVNEHFERLFTSLFNGGKASLQLTESDDPLEAGLEIMARPPGKRLQTLSLLSGGEQALTAMALIFAVFLTNPSPICVLDEVDAPLDDANVERFCNMLQEMCSETNTRFLVITHHALTMSRVDRLFGVTMGERGVSQLVSVDLETAESFREAV